MFDIILRQGLILDGTAAPGKVADLGIVGDQIKMCIRDRRMPAQAGLKRIWTRSWAWS